MRRLLLPILLAALWGCSPWAIHYEPRSVRESSQLVSRAKRVYRDDLEELAAAGGKPIGKLFVGVGTGYPPAEDDIVHGQAEAEAAQRGGTHLFVAGEEQEKIDYVTVNRVFNTTIAQSGTYSRSKGFYYLVIRVPKEGLEKLDGALKPLLRRPY
jgi:hypothetical protein